MSARRRDRIAGTLVVVVALVAAGSAAVHELGSSPSHSTGSGGTPAGVRNLAAAWVAGEVSPAALVSCDPVMCTTLRKHGFSDLMQVTSGGKALLRSAVVVATSAVRQEVGGALSSVYAPDVIARFGTGAGQIDIRTVAKDGPARYRQQLNADQQERRESGLQMLNSPRLVVAPVARVQLSSGQVDARVLVTIALLAGQQPYKVLAFGDSGPAAATGPSPLRSVDVTQVPGRKQLTTAEFVHTTLSFLRAQKPPYYALHVTEIQLPKGGAAIRVIFSAPSPLGLLAGSVPTAPGG